tara:strand:+ start:3488 stop:4093 length:606 start_codon:yes stop_codon:yes gene_type:complete
MKNQNPIAEIIESSTKSLVVQCYELYQAPKLGTLIKTLDDPSIIGIVYNVFTEPLDPSRRPIARGPFKNEPEKLYEDNPHLSLLFRTQAEIFILGHSDQLKDYRYELPLLPAKIHTGISLLDEKEILAFTNTGTFLELLIEGLDIITEEIFSISIRRISGYHNDAEKFLFDTGKDVASNFPHDQQKLISLLRKLGRGPINE